MVIWFLVTPDEMKRTQESATVNFVRYLILDNSATILVTRHIVAIWTFKCHNGQEISDLPDLCSVQGGLSFNVGGRETKWEVRVDCVHR